MTSGRTSCSDPALSYSDVLMHEWNRWCALVLPLIAQLFVLSLSDACGIRIDAALINKDLTRIDFAGG